MHIDNLNYIFFNFFFIANIKYVFFIYVQFILLLTLIIYF